MIDFIYSHPFGMVVGALVVILLDKLRQHHINRPDFLLDDLSRNYILSILPLADTIWIDNFNLQSDYSLIIIRKKKMYYLYKSVIGHNNYYMEWRRGRIKHGERFGLTKISATRAKIIILNDMIGDKW